MTRKRPGADNRPSTRAHKATSNKTVAAPESKQTKLIKFFYERERSLYESLLSGKQIEYRAPASYDGKSALYVEGEDDAKVENSKKSIWRTLADFFSANKIDPRLYIRVQFEPSQLGLRRAPEPTQLMTPECIHVYHQALARIGPTVELALLTQRAVASAAIVNNEELGCDRDQAVITVITNDSIELSPLFRYCLAWSMGTDKFRKLARLYQDHAVIQFQRFRQYYQRYWSEWLPVGFVLLADKIYPTLITYEE